MKTLLLFINFLFLIDDEVIDTYSLDDICVHVTKYKDNNKIKSIELDFTKVYKEYKYVEVELLIEKINDDVPISLTPNKVYNAYIFKDSKNKDCEKKYLAYDKKKILFSENKIIKFDNLLYETQKISFSIRYNKNKRPYYSEIILI